MHSWLAYPWDVRVIKQQPVNYFCIGCELRMVFIVLNHQAGGDQMETTLWHTDMTQNSNSSVHKWSFIGIKSSNIVLFIHWLTDSGFFHTTTAELRSCNREHILPTKPPNICSWLFTEEICCFLLYVLQVLPCNVYGLLCLNISN